MLRSFIVAAILMVISIVPANAQSAKSEWIQVEAYQTQEEALERILVYKTFLPSIAGFKLKNGWYAVVVGPFSTLESKFLLSQFRQTELIPPDSYISSTDVFERRFYPPTAESDVLPETPAPQPTPRTDTVVQVSEPETPTIQVSDETLSQARASERLLSKDEKKQLQIALKDGGYYTGAIDGLYGKGTRASMRRWQDANRYEPTGILTSGQRQALLDQYFAVLAPLNMRRVIDRAAGIEIEMPTAVVGFDSYTAPFAHYTAFDEGKAEIHLISQPGDRTSLYALYDVLETLSIVPLEGRRKKNRNNFVLTGQNDQIITHAEAFLSGGQIKGYIIVWPAGQPHQAERLIERMTGSFEVTSSVLPKGQGTEVEPGQSALGGLEFRTATSVVSGVFLNSDGTVLTTSEISASCEKISAFDDSDYNIIARSPELGITLLAPKTTVSPQNYATFNASENRINSKIALSGYSFGGLLGAPTLTYGSIAATSGLQGEPHLDRLELSHFAPDSGGPVLGVSGDVVGILNARDLSSERQLPNDVSFMTDNTAIVEFLRSNGILYFLNASQEPKSGVEIERHARDITVWLSCWE